MTEKRIGRTWADFGIAVLNKELAIPAFFMLCFLILLWRLPAERLANISDKILLDFTTNVLFMLLWLYIIYNNDFYLV